MPNMKELLNTLPQIGKIEKIGLRPARRVALKQVESAIISIEDGLEGDRYNGKSKKRQITLIQSEHLEAVASFLKKNKITHNEVRRNIIVSGINLLALKEKQFRIGNEVILEMTGLCHPCSRMEESLGAGGYNGMRGHSGITAKVIQGGKIKLDNPIQMILKEHQNIAK